MFVVSGISAIPSVERAATTGRQIRGHAEIIVPTADFAFYAQVQLLSPITPHMSARRFPNGTARLPDGAAAERITLEELGHRPRPAWLRSRSTRRLPPAPQRR
jgi:hypothetical protein